MTAGEQPEEAIRRELQEETGIELENLKMLGVKTIGRHVEILFSAVTAGEASVQSREILGLGWFTKNNLPEHLPASQKDVIRRLLR